MNKMFLMHENDGLKTNDHKLMYDASTYPIGKILGVYRPRWILLDSLVFNDSSIYTGVTRLDANGSLRCLRVQHIMIIAVGAVLVAFLVRSHILPECLFALLAHECHLGRPREGVGLLLSVTFRTVEPQLAAGCTN